MTSERIPDDLQMTPKCLPDDLQMSRLKTKYKSICPETAPQTGVVFFIFFVAANVSHGDYSRETALWHIQYSAGY